MRMPLSDALSQKGPKPNILMYYVWEGCHLHEGSDEEYGLPRWRMQAIFALKEMTFACTRYVCMYIELTIDRYG